MSKKLKIVIFHCGFIYSGGGERIVLEEAKELKKRGYTVEVWAPTLDAKKCYPDDIKLLNVRTFLPQLPRIVPGRFALQMVFSCCLGPLFAYRFRYIDVFVGENQPGAWIAFCIAKILRKPYLVYMNQPNRLLYPRPIDITVQWENLRDYYFVHRLINLVKRFVFWADRISFTSGNAMLVNGGYIGGIIGKIYKKEGVVCPAGGYVWPKNEISTMQEIYQGKTHVINLKGQKFIMNKPYILLTNRHVPQKKFHYAIEAMRETVKKFPEVLLVIPGPYTSHTKELQKLAMNRGVSKNILFLDQISENELQKLYKYAAVYVYTAPDEDFGMGVIEAMGWGVPVVAWNFAGPTGTVVNGKTGFLAKPYDRKDFEQKMLTILSDQKLRMKFGKNARGHVAKNFSWQRHTDIVEKELLKALAKANNSVNL